jgi:hypothetical protein
VDKKGVIEGGVTKRLVLNREGKKKGAILFTRIVFIDRGLQTTQDFGFG